MTSGWPKEFKQEENFKRGRTTSLTLKKYHLFRYIIFNLNKFLISLIKQYIKQKQVYIKNRLLLKRILVKVIVISNIKDNSLYTLYHFQLVFV